MLWLVGRSRSRSDRWWDADQAFPVRGHGHTMKPALTGMTLVRSRCSLVQLLIERVRVRVRVRD